MLSSATPASSAVSAQIFERVIRKRGRECPRCGGRHRDTQYRTCGPCRDLTAAYHKAYRHDHIARKLCPECCVAKGKVTKTCEYHREYANAHGLHVRADQRTKGLCAYARCKNPAPDSYRCEEHAEKFRQYALTYQQRLQRRRPRRWAA